MFDERKSPFEVNVLGDHRTVPVHHDCELTVFDLSRSITGSSLDDASYLLVSSTLISSGGSFRWLANRFAHTVGQTATCIALSFGNVMDVRRRMASFDEPDVHHAREEALSELIRWLRVGEARADVPAFRLSCERRLSPILPALDPLSGMLQQSWHTGQ